MTAFNRTTAPDPVSDIQGIADLVSEVHKEYSYRYPRLWFRGQAVSGKELLPKILRQEFVDWYDGKPMNPDRLELRNTMRELQINKEISRLGESIFPPGRTLTHQYFLHQHHGFPTRLLDWSTNLLAALYFACCDHPDKDGEVFFLKKSSIANPLDCIFDGKPFTRSDPHIMRESDPIVNDIIRNIMLDEAPKYVEIQSVIPIYPDLHAGRMIQQGAAFTIFPPKAPLVSMYSSVRSYIVPSKLKRVFLDEMKILGITQFTLFPDLDNLGKEISDLMTSTSLF